MTLPLCRYISILNVHRHQHTHTNTQSAPSPRDGSGWTRLAIVLAPLVLVRSEERVQHTSCVCGDKVLKVDQDQTLATRASFSFLSQKKRK